jgi:diguanylate cyclase (GGDEF)-like protein
MNTRESELLLEITKYKLLFQATSNFHTYLDKDKILSEIIATLKKIYPEFTYFFFLSQDHQSSNNLPIIDLDYESDNIQALTSYISGNIQMEKQNELYVPLKGKQGVYGVTQIIANDDYNFSKDAIEFITLLTNAAGSALENVKLYDQSRQVISELQLINETSQQLNSNLRLTDTMKYMSNQIKQTFNAQEVGFFLFSKDHKKVRVLPGSTPFFMTKESITYIDNIENKLLQDRDALFIGDFKLSDRNNVVSFRSIMAVPIIQSRSLKGFTLVMHHEPFFFPFESFNLLQSLLNHSSLALTNSLLREELEQMIIIDNLTKLNSRNFLDENIQFSMKEDNEGTFLLIDIDNFKEINDSYGHQVGDDILVQVANIIKNNIRGDDVGARWGGEELAIYLPKASIDEGMVIAERLVKKVAKSTNPQITISCGVSYWNKDSQDTYNYLFKRADDALYLAKGTGKNKVVAQKTA